MSFKSLLLLGLLSVFSLLAISPAMAQLDRSERRALRREIRRLSPEDYHRMKEQQAALQQTVTELSERQSQLQQEIQDKDRQINTLKNELSRLESQLQERGEQIAELREKEQQWEQGVVFRVQIGAFRDYDFQDATGSSPNLIYETDSNWHKYVLGNFRKYEEADRLKKHLRRTGIRDAWIVPYKDGERVPLKEVLDQVVEEIRN